MVNITDVGHAVARTGDSAAAGALDLLDAAIAADFNTSRLLAALQDALRDPAITPAGLRTVTAAADALLGLGLAVLDPADLETRRSAGDLTPEERHAIEQLVADRTRAREEHDWARADQIRAELDARGVDLTDTPEGPVWYLRLPAATCGDACGLSAAHEHLSVFIHSATPTAARAREPWTQ